MDPITSNILRNNRYQVQTNLETQITQIEIETDNETVNNPNQ
jgi:hypothetical protein